MAAEESLQTTRTESLHVRLDRDSHWLCALHGVPASVLQARSTAAQSGQGSQREITMPAIILYQN